MAVLVVGALARRGRGTAEPRRRGLGARDPRQVGRRSLFLPLRALEARATGRSVAHVGFALAAVAVAALATWRYGTAWLGAFGPLARNANDETRFAVPYRLEQLGAAALARDRRARARLRGSPTPGCCARPGAAARGSASPPRCSCSRRRTSRPGTLVWTVPLAAADEDEPAQLLALALTASTCCRRPSRSKALDPPEDEHAVLLEDEPEAPVAPQPAIERAYGSGLDRIEVPGPGLVDGDPLGVVGGSES